MRYALIFEAMLRSGRSSYGEVRDRQTGHLRVLCFAGLLWQLFRSLIEGALDALAAMPLGKANNLQQELALTRVVFC